MSPLECCAASASALAEAGSFSSQTEGKVVCKVGFIDYKQNVFNRRVVTPDAVFTEAISTSVLKKVAEQKYSSHGLTLVRGADKISLSATEWSNSFARMDAAEYEAAYGLSPRLLTNYLINEDTVLEALLFDNRNGSYTVELTLDPQKSTIYYRRQVMTCAGASEPPEFTAVRFSLTFGGDMLPVEAVFREKYSLSVPLIGSAECSGSTCEVFSGFNEPQTIPFADEFDAQFAA